MSTTVDRPKLSIAQHDKANDELGFRFVRALAVEKAALDKRLDPSCIRVLAAISYFMNGSVKRAWPSYRLIAQVTGYSEDRIERAIQRLRVSGYIFTERKAPITGGRALVHYGLAQVHPKDLEEVVTAAVREIAAKMLTPAKITGSTTTPAKVTGSEKKPNNSSAVAAHPVKKSGVSSPRQKERGEGADPGIFAASDPGVFADSNPVLKNPVSEVQSRAARIGTDLLNPGVALPASIQIAIDGGRAKVGARNLVDAIEAALSRGVEAQKIEMALRKSVAAAVKDAGDRDPPASSILSRAIWYVERSDGERIAEPLAPRGPRARMPVKDFDVPDIPDDQLPSINTTWED